VFERDNAAIDPGRQLTIDVFAAHPGKMAKLALVEIKPQAPVFAPGEGQALKIAG
jgi:hypothetical protein